MRTESVQAQLETGARRRARRRALALLCAGALLGGCATTYDLTLMPRDSGKVTYGTARDIGNGQANVSLAVGDKIYSGTWVQIKPEGTTDYVGASAWGWGGWAPFGGVDRTNGNANAKALLQAQDGSGMRCDLYGLTGGKGSGQCTDDKGTVYDVQLRARNYK